MSERKIPGYGEGLKGRTFNLQLVVPFGGWENERFLSVVKVERDFLKLGGHLLLLMGVFISMDR